MGRYRSWRYRRRFGSQTPSKYRVLMSYFGDAITDIRQAFFNFDTDALDSMLSDYGDMYGSSAESYARKTFPLWKSGNTKLSGQTMERLVELVPPYLSANQRYDLLSKVIHKHKVKCTTYKSIRINVKEPSLGFSELNSALDSMSHDDMLAHIPENVMKAASWLYDDDISAARAMLAQATRLENELIKSNAKKEIELLRKTISTGQVQSASYSVTMPAGQLNVVAYTPSKCFIATVCYGEQAWETQVLRYWRDSHLINTSYGRSFIVWYYTHGEHLSKIIEKHKVIKLLTKSMVSPLVKFVYFCNRKELS